MTLLRVKFSKLVDSDTLQRLHSSGLGADAPEEIRKLIDSVGAQSLSAVFPMRAGELDRDSYGFGAQFKLYIPDNMAPELALRTLQESPLVDEAKLETFRRPAGAL